MWEFWRSRLSKGKTRHRRGLGTFSEDDSPSVRDSLDERMLSLPTPGEVADDSSHVYFKDIILPASDESEDETESQHSESGDPALQAERELRRTETRKKKMRVDRQKLIIILVGLPGRGKTFLCNKLMCYLNWLGHETRHFNVGQYRRKQRGDDEVQDASFFDHNNQAGMKAREVALFAALDDMQNWLGTDEAQVAIFDATNSTEQRRQLLRERFHGKWQYLFIESICNDPSVLEQNYRFKMMYSPDYKDVDTEAAILDFKERIRNYEEVYETITDRNLHYIKLIDMVTGRGYMDVNRISGYIPGKMVFFLMQVCKAGVARVRKIWLTRHGESEYNQHELLGGDSLLSPNGEIYARLLPDALVDRVPLTADGNTMPVSVWTSTLQRTIMTAEELPFPKLRWKVLDEIQAGIFDGWTYKRIEQERPDQAAERKADKLRYRYPSGESYLDVIQRLEPVIIEIERERECVCVVAHQAVLRALYGYFTKTPLSEVPRIEIPLHTLIELVPKPDGKMAEERIKFDLQHESVASYLNQSGNTPLATQDSMLTALTPYASMNMRQDHDPIAKALASGRQNSIGPQEIIHHRAGLRFKGSGGSGVVPSGMSPPGWKPPPVPSKSPMGNKQPAGGSRLSTPQAITNNATPFAAQTVQASRGSFSRSTRSPNESARSSSHSGSQTGDQASLPPRRGSATSHDGGSSNMWGLKSRRNSHNGTVSAPISEAGDNSVHGGQGRPSLDKKSSHSLPPDAFIAPGTGSPPRKSVRKSSSWRALTETIGNFRKSSSHRSLASNSSGESHR